MKARISRPWRVLALAVLVAVAGCGTVAGMRAETTDAGRTHLDDAGWPAQGQAAYRLGSATPVIGPHQRPAPIASVAKVMTAYVVLSRLPLRDGQAGPTILVRPQDVDDFRQRRADGQSVVAVESGERLDERDALEALLLPSANNVAILLARLVSGSVAAFVSDMNAAARRLGMRDTTYTDPSGYDPGTVSTAADQLTLAGAMTGNRTFSEIVARTGARIPVAGLVTNTNKLLGSDGFVGTKTGSDDAAGGCFMFLTWRMVGGRKVPMLGVVLGQPGHDQVAAGLDAARQLVHRVAPTAG